MCGSVTTISSPTVDVRGPQTHRDVREARLKRAERLIVCVVPLGMKVVVNRRSQREELGADAPQPGATVRHDEPVVAAEAAGPGVVAFGVVSLCDCEP